MVTIAHPKPSSLTYLTMPAGSKYLSDKLPDTLPQNCLFDKVLTGCGGTFVALASYQPYIVAVPTKALVYDKVTSNTYSSFNIQGVSEDFPLSASRDFSKSTKIITTYKSLKSLCERSDVDISKYHLLIDEVHMLSSMTSYAKDELHWILNNFKNFKSYCFMSATMPRADHLLPELRDLNRVLAVWPDLTPVQFNCYVATKIQDSLLEIMYQHKIRKREGTPYFFYNSVTAICNLVKAWNQQDKVPATFNIICGDTDVNRSKLRAVGQEIGKPNIKADFHFITATAFEGVDFYDPEGVTYIISDRSYATTKYSIETTIPQIVGRLRDSKYNQEVTVIYNQHNTSIAMTPREFANYLDDRELNTKRSIEIYNELKSSVKTDKYLRDTLESTLKSLVENPYALVEGFIKDFEDLVTEYDFQSDVYPNIEYYPYTKIIAQQTYDLFHEERYVRGDQKALGDPLSLGKLKGDAPDLSDETAELFKKKSVGLKVICNLYEKDPKACKDKYPEWYDIIESLGVEAIAKASYFKRKVKKMAEAKVTIERPSIQQQIFNAFKVGEVYSSSYIRSVLEKIDGIHSRKATALRVWFQMEAFMKNNRTHYRIIRKL